MNRKPKRKINKKKRQQFLRSRRGVVLIGLIAVTVLLINLITASYSWFTPQNVNGSGMTYVYENAKARSESCTISTFSGTLVTASNQSSHPGYYINQIHYENPATSVSISKGDTKYFRTEIINADTVNASNVSLYIKGITNVAINNTCTVAVTYPSNSVRTFTSNGENFIIRNAYVKRKDTQDVNGPGLLAVEWFVTNNGNTAITVNPNNLFLTYN